MQGKSIFKKNCNEKNNLFCGVTVKACARFKSEIYKKKKIFFWGFVPQATKRKIWNFKANLLEGGKGTKLKVCGYLLCLMAPICAGMKKKLESCFKIVVLGDWIISCFCGFLKEDLQIQIWDQIQRFKIFWIFFVQF